MKSVSPTPRRERRPKERLDVPEVVAVMEQMTVFTNRLVILVLLVIISVFSLILLLLHASGVVTLPAPVVAITSTIYGASFIGGIAKAALRRR